MYLHTGEIASSIHLGGWMGSTASPQALVKELLTPAGNGNTINRTSFLRD
jgi:hypothetical protein